jgi:phage repressor protein C with HTH and peptisase S24 domain
VRPAAADEFGGAASEAAADGGCSGGESFALRVLGDEMAPEFNHGEIIIVEPDGALKDGSFVLARHAGEWIFRQLCRRGEGWVLHALNPARGDLPDLALPGLDAVHGVVIQKAVPGRRRLSKHYR